MKNYILSNHAEKVITERKIRHEWIDDAFSKPDKIEIDTKDNNLEHKLKIIEEFDNRVLRVVCNKFVEPVMIVTAFFDRKMKGKIR